MLKNAVLLASTNQDAGHNSSVAYSIWTECPFNDSLSNINRSTDCPITFMRVCKRPCLWRSTYFQILLGPDLRLVSVFHLPGDSEVVMPEHYIFLMPIKRRGALFILSRTVYKMCGGGFLLEISARPWPRSKPTRKISSSALRWYRIQQTSNIYS